MQLPHSCEFVILYNICTTNCHVSVKAGTQIRMAYIYFTINVKYILTYLNYNYIISFK